MDNGLRLELFKQYNRKDVHNIFDPYSPFTSGSGTWGIHGIVKIPNREGYVFFVTFGQKMLGHEFEEEVTEEGVLTWQSQPKQKLSDAVIRTLIRHNHLKNNIYLFLRTRRINPTTKKSEPFTYLGKMAYLNHDNQREAPVYFKWQIINWEIPSQEILERMNLQLTASGRETEGEGGTLQETDKPSRSDRQNGTSTRGFHARHVNFAENNDRNQKIGIQGELLVLEHEKSRLIANGRSDLASKVIHTSIVEGDGAGFDIQSYTTDGEVKFIEVKTTTAGIQTPFILTSNEVAFSEKHSDSYILYRVYDYNHKIHSGSFYTLKGDITNKVNLEPTQFKAWV
ncbi:DUF3427 domain-containing protein [Peribacillus frigoritolerans]